MNDDIHEVYAVCYASHARKRSENYIFGDPHDELTSIAYYVWGDQRSVWHFRMRHRL